MACVSISGAFAVQASAQEPSNPPPQRIATATVLTPAQIFEYNADAVFTIYASFDNRNFASIGSGFFVCPTGIAITNHHVIVGWPYAIIRTHGGQEFEISGYFSYDKDNDLAVIQIAATEPNMVFPYLTIGDSDSLRVGENVYTIGSPLGYHNTFSAGMVSRFNEVSEFGTYRIYGMIQITAPISGGSSGGALFNNAGHVVGITTAGYTGAGVQALNFAVPIARVDLTSTNNGQYTQLPVGDELDAVPDSVLYGSWTWVRGTYVFNENGTGSRVWDGVPDDFEWRILMGVLILSFDDDYPAEYWGVVVINEDTVIIGGALFSRAVSGSQPAATPSVLEGTWSWAGGWYAFMPDGSGSRVWDGIAATFQWSVVDNSVVFRLANGSEERWSFSIVNENEVHIGGALFTRTG